MIRIASFSVFQLEYIKIVSSESSEQCRAASADVVVDQHVIASLNALGFAQHIPFAVSAHSSRILELQKARQRKKTRVKLTVTEEAELARKVLCQMKSELRVSSMFFSKRLCLHQHVMLPTVRSAEISAIKKPRQT